MKIKKKGDEQQPASEAKPSAKLSHVFNFNTKQPAGALRLNDLLNGNATASAEKGGKKRLSEDRLASLTGLDP